jgi:hypothetical protein
MKLMALAAAALVVAAAPARAIPVTPVFTDIGATNVFTSSGAPLDITKHSFHLNTVRRFSYKAGVDGGGGFVIPISNGENGRNLTAGPGPNGLPTNTDVPNPTPVGDAIAAVNNGGRIQNGNAFRFSVWIQQDPAKPIVIEPSVEPLLKFELWSEAQSTYADFDGTALEPAFGDRLWDTDINGRNAYFAAFDQSQSSVIDINNDGDTPSGAIPVASIPPATGEQWTLVQTTIVIDDHPDDISGWRIAGVDYFVDAIEEIRATFFTGEFTGQAGTFANGGNFFVDNALLEVFANVADMEAVPEPPNPVPRGLAGDFDQDVDVDGADFLTWQRGLPLLFSAADLQTWKDNYGALAAPAVSATILAYGRAAPEPHAAALALVALAGLAASRRRA